MKRAGHQFEPTPEERRAAQQALAAAFGGMVASLRDKSA
jgi:hypothetical protein